MLFDKLLIIMYFFLVEDNWFFIWPPPLFQNSGSAPVYVEACMKSYIIHRHKLGHKYLKSRLVVAILNFSKITCTFPDGG